MPIYVYKNLNTGETFELSQPITADALTEHPQTGDPVKRIVQPVGIAFKGSGFYVNDSRPKSSSATASAGAGKSSSDATTTPASSGTSSDSTSKPASPAPAAASAD